MAHVRKNCSKPSQTISFDPKIYEAAEDYLYESRKKNFSHSVNELIAYGLKYVALVEKKKARDAEKVTG